MILRARFVSTPTVTDKPRNPRCSRPSFGGHELVTPWRVDTMFASPSSLQGAHCAAPSCRALHWQANIRAAFGESDQPIEALALCPASILPVPGDFGLLGPGIKLALGVLV